MSVYFNGNLMDKSQVAISPDDRGFLFADGVYEVLRAYNGVLFEMGAHLQRLQNGLAALRIGPVEIDEIQSATQRLLVENGLREATVYIQITRGCAPRNHAFPPPESRPTVYIEARAFAPATELQASGVGVILVPDQRWARCDIKTVGLLPNVLASQRAKEEGAFEALLVRDGAVLEGSRANVFFVRNGVLATAPLNNYILPGITRRVVLEVAREAELPVELRPCFEQELRECDEIFLAGTTVEVLPIVRIGSSAIGKGVPGPITRILQSGFERRRSA